MATHAKMVCKNQERSRRGDSSQIVICRFATHLVHSNSCAVIHAYILLIICASCFSASGFPQKGSSLPHCLLCSISPQEGAKSLAHSSPLTAGKQGQALQGFSLVFCTGERGKRILPPMIVTCTNCINTSCAFKAYYIWNVKSTQLLKVAAFAGFQTTITTVVQTTQREFYWF